MIWVTGSRGMLGKDITGVLNKRGIPFVESDIEIDLTSKISVLSFVKDRNIDWIINCAAYTAVDAAEDERKKAFSVNSDVLMNLVDAAIVNDSRIIHFSTDYVYDGNKKSGYSEDDPTGPAGAYGASKLAGEIILRENYERYFIFRISWLYGFYGKNFVSTMLNLFNQKDEINVVNDQYGSPTNTFELASFIAHIIKTDPKNYGVYNFSGEGITTWYEFAREIYTRARMYGILNKDVAIHPISSSQYPTKARRPEYSYMLKEKLFNTFSYKPANWKETLDMYIKELKTAIR